MTFVIICRKENFNKPSSTTMDGVDYHPAPEWLTESYFEEVLRRNKNDDGLKIITLQVKPATAKGDNYASIMTRINVNYLRSNSKTVQRGSYIAKTTYENDPFVSSIFNGYQVYKTEMLMYEKVLSKLSELLKEAGDEDKLFAETLYVDYEHDANIFEDLAVLNYGLADRLAGLNLTLTKLALKKVAKMHATAAVFNERQPGLLTKLDRGIFNRHTRAFSPFFEGMLEVAANFAGNCPELGCYYKEKLLNLRSHVMEYAERVYDSNDQQFNTLVHGDYWVNNIMVRYAETAEKEVKDLLLIDFQFCNWSTPAIDLHYLFNTSLQGEVRFKQEDALVKYYYEMLRENLRKLNYKGFIPTLHQFVIQFENGRFYAVIAALTHQPFMITDQTNDADFHALMGTDERARNFRSVTYENKIIQDSMKRLLPKFDQKGLLDIVD